MKGRKTGGRKKGTPNKKTKQNFKNFNLQDYKSCGVYAIKTHNFYKIGMASSVYQRVMTLNNCNPYGVEIVKIVKTKNRDDATRLEKKLHNEFYSSRLHGEWFELTESQITYLNNIE